MKESRLERQALESLAYALTFPIVGHPAWAGTIPDDLRRQMPLIRMCQLMKEPETFLEQATDEEAMAYIMTASLAAPIRSEWVNIYMSLTRRYMLGQGRAPEELPDFLREEITLDEYENGLLTDLKRWIRKQQFKHVKAKGKRKETTDGKGLTFDGGAVADAIRHAADAKRHRKLYDGDDRPALWFVKDDGIYVMSNGRGKKAPIVYACGYDPRMDADVWDKSREAVGGDDFVETLPVDDALLRAEDLLRKGNDFFVKVSADALDYGVVAPKRLIETERFLCDKARFGKKEKR